MRARHRHFNPAHAGADVCLDARYGFSQSDDTEVSTWEDRSNNNKDATQSTANYRPKYRTNALNGQPSLQFLPLTNQQKFLDGTHTITSNVLTTFMLFDMDSTTPNFGRVVAYSKDNLNDYDSSSRGNAALRNFGNNIISAYKNTFLASINISGNTRYHFTSTFTGSQCVTRLNESTTATSSASGNFDVNKFRVGFALDPSSTPPGSSGLNGAWKGYISHVSIFNANVAASLRKRIQFHNAFSHKLSCN